MAEKRVNNVYNSSAVSANNSYVFIIHYYIVN